MRSRRNPAPIVALSRTNGARPRSKPVKRWEDRWSFIAMIFVLCLFVVVLVNSVLRQAAETLVGATTEPRTTEGP